MNQPTSRKIAPAQDFYPTPPEATWALVEVLRPYLPPRAYIWEPACGEGDMVRVLWQAGYSAYATDIQQGVDYLQAPLPDRCQAIITNPPFKLADRFIEKAVQEVPVVAMLLKSQYWHARKRYVLFRKHPSALVCPLTWRVDFLKGAKGGRPTMEVAWSIWLPGHQGTQYLPLLKPRRE